MDARTGMNTSLLLTAIILSDLAPIAPIIRVVGAPVDAIEVMRMTDGVARKLDDEQREMIHWREPLTKLGTT